MEKGLLIVMSGPSGSGKSTVNQTVRDMCPNIKKSISVTTRPMRPGEVDGVHYFFRTVEQYTQMIADGAFLETASVYTNNYGTPRTPVVEMLEQGYDVLLEIDTIGAAQVRRTYPGCVMIFITPPDMKELEKRLIERNTETPESLKLRLRAAKREISKIGIYDYVVCNDTPENAARKMIAIVEGEKCAVARNKELVNNLQKGE